MMVPNREEGRLMVSQQNTVRKTTCHGCTRRCGLLVTVEEGRPVGLKGDESQPMSRGFFCHRGKAMALEQPVDKLRLRHPLKRIGGRGEGKWMQISWEQALEVAENDFEAPVFRAHPSLHEIKRALMALAR